jgi:hypothetical protein
MLIVVEGALASAGGWDTGEDLVWLGDSRYNSRKASSRTRRSTSLFNRDNHAKHFAPWSMKTTSPEFSAVIVVEGAIVRNLC